VAICSGCNGTDSSERLVGFRPREQPAEGHQPTALPSSLASGSCTAMKLSGRACRWGLASSWSRVLGFAPRSGHGSAIGDERSRYGNHILRCR